MTLKVKVNDPHFQYQLRECIIGTNLVILAQIHYKLAPRQVRFPRILSQNGQNDIEGQGQWPPFSIPAASIPWCMCSANLVIPAQICDKLLRGQAKFQNDRNFKMTEMNLKVAVSDPHFKYQLRVSQDACLVQM